MKSFPLFAALSLVACSHPAAGPLLFSVEPARASAFVPTAIVIRGEDIAYATVADLDRPSQSTFSLGMHLRLIGPERVELLDAQRISTTEVRAKVPPTLTRGRYTLELTTDRGTARLTDALEIAD
jgi:hypothetical protein